MMTMDYRPEPERHYFGLDLGQARDYTALVVLTREGQSPLRGDEREPPTFDARAVCCAIGAIKRYPLGTAYPAIVDDVAQNLLRAPSSAKLILDGTGVGRPVVDLFLAHPKLTAFRSRIFPVTITAGHTVTKEGSYIRVPKRDLVGVVQARLQTGRLKIAETLPETPTLIKELQNFRAKVTAAANVTFGAGDDWREGSNDDLVLAAALACWGAESAAVNQQFEQSQWVR